MQYNIIILLLLLVLPFGIKAQFNSTETFTKEFTLNGNAGSQLLVVRNIFGDVNIEGYSGNTVQLEAKITIEASTEEKLKIGKQEVGVANIQKDELTYVSYKIPCEGFSLEAFTKEQLIKGQFQWNQNCHWKPVYEYRIDFTLKVPKRININASTVNNGEISIKNVEGKFNGNNVNGGILFDQVAGAVCAHTINGDVTVNFTKVPVENCKIYDFNGDIKVNIPKGFSADVTFETTQGDFFTDIEDITLKGPDLLPVKNKGKGVAFKVETKEKLQVRKGGILFEFETFNGNVYLKEK